MNREYLGTVCRLVCLNMKIVSLLKNWYSISHTKLKYLQKSSIFNAFFFCFLGMYFASSMILVSFSCAMTVLVLNIHFRGATGNKLPNWMRKLFLKRLAWILFVKTGKATSNKVHSEKNDTKKQVTENVFKMFA